MTATHPLPAHPISMPDIGSGRWKVEICSWLVEVGETVREGDRLVEVSLPGMTFDVSSPAEGRLISIERATGSEVRPGDILGSIQICDIE